MNGTDAAWVNEQLQDREDFASVKVAQVWLRRVLETHRDIDIEDIRPVPAWYTEETPEDELTEQAEEAIAFLRAYTGTFPFLTELRDRERQGSGLTENMVAAVLRCKARETERTEDPRLAEAAAELNRLAGEGGLNDFTMSLLRQFESKGSLSPRQIDALLKKRPERKAPSEPTATEGMYRTADGTIFKVQKAVHGSGRLYAKRLVPPTEHGGRARFEYEQGAIFKLQPSDRMTLEAAREFGALYGTCCVCGRTLTDEQSIANGIGPICEGREWGE